MKRADIGKLQPGIPTPPITVNLPDTPVKTTSSVGLGIMALVGFGLLLTLFSKK